MDTSASSTQAPARDTLAALDEIRRHDQLLASSWRQLLDTAYRRTERLAVDRHDHLSLRSSRATAATAAAEAAQAARFEAHMLKMAPAELAAAHAQLESQIRSLRASQIEAATHLNAAIGGLLTALDERVAHRTGTGSATGAARCRARLADDAVSAMRAYADRIEQILLDLGDGVRAAVGVSMGGALPTRISREPPRPDLDRIAVSDAARLSLELADAVWRSVELYRDRLDERVDDGVRTLRARLDRAAESSRVGDERRRERIAELMGAAQQLDALAAKLDWMLPADCAAAPRR